MQSDSLSQSVTVTTVTKFIEQQSDVNNNRFVFTYHITITNDSPNKVQLLSRHWIIKDSNLKTEEVYGEGVIGEQPVILPGNSFKYTSGAILKTEVGTMEGKYFLVCDDSKESDSIEFEISIPKFTLSVPRTVH